ncbi:malto-oligosyltrehalose trehalohydrolase [Corynebacterium liangguodongii]|uniref:Malto-oligosyltrehalose trehalohydrolase n=1 Tax=Corynebacterium liangguodongii TaxID=2079535 RepID=A0A2S0WEY2_9CORY|nr:malto-oligosyltrehalose trehalohydrolase [Corynebacterium liangguodongii]AWB84331.1 malto-oligosyltrehalose trehalohydrolase [Corynebacterium liangguodongii]PWB99821.1 malto-oligosyltrehalose trehalohydrolase [Corynebacterium liangguodongii]
MSLPERFEVWAPFAHDVRLLAEGAEYQMESDASRSGWWVADAAAPAPHDGQRYAYRLFDGTDWSKPLPDPRSRAQPEGIHGPSEVVSADFEWTDGAWGGAELRGQVIYELHVGTFSEAGTFAGVVDKLDYLLSLGVSAIELMPVQPFAGTRNWGYDGVDWYAVQESYGGPRGLKALIDAAHARGIAVILDVVYNHFGPDGNYNGAFGPYTTAGSTGWGDVVNISGPASDEVRAYILGAVEQWLGEFHADGLRLDAVHAYDDRRAYSIMEDIQALADSVAASTGVPRTIIAESDLNDPRVISPASVGGYGLTAQWLDDVHHCLHTLISGEHHAYYMDYGTVEVLADTLRHGYRFRNTYSQFRRRTHGRALDLSITPPWRLITYTTTHDQTGNRAAGDRPSHNLTAAQQVLKAAVVLCSPFTPMLFMGEEFGARTPFPFFCSHTDDELNRLTREGRLREFSRLGWDPEDVLDPSSPETFEAARLDWTFDASQDEIFEAYQALIGLRAHYGLARTDLRELKVENSDTWLTMGDDAVVLAANFSDTPVDVPVGGTLVYSFTDPAVSADSTRLGPWEFAVIER